MSFRKDFFRLVVACAAVIGTGIAPAKERASWKAPDGVNTFALSPDGKQLALAVSARDYFAEIWQVPATKRLQTLVGHERVIACLTYAADGKTLASGSVDGLIKLWDTATWKEKARLQPPDSFLTSVGFSPDGRLLAAAVGRKQGNSFVGVLKVYDVATWREHAAYRGHEDRVITCVAFAPDGRTLYSGGQDGMVRGWDVATGKQTASLRTYFAILDTLVVEPAGRTVAIGGETATRLPPGRQKRYRGEVLLWDPPAERERIWIDHGRFSASRVRFSPDGQLLAAAGHWREVRVYDASTGTLVAALKGHEGKVRDVTFTPDGKSLLSIASDRTIKLWDLPHLTKD